MNKDDKLVMVDGEKSESMYEWTFLQAGIGMKATKTVTMLLKNKRNSVMPKADLSDPSL